MSDRLLGARLVLQRASMARALSFEYLNRQLVLSSAPSVVRPYSLLLRRSAPCPFDSDLSCRYCLAVWSLRQVWTELSELLLFLLPLLNVTQLRSRIMAYLPRAMGAPRPAPLPGLPPAPRHICASHIERLFFKGRCRFSRSRPVSLISVSRHQISVITGFMPCRDGWSGRSPAAELCHL